MATLIPKVGACLSCLDPVYDASCGETDCLNFFVVWHRMAGACVCTCNEMGFVICPIYQDIEHCPCADDTTEPGQVIIGAWLAFSPPSETLASIVAQTCPDDQRVIYRFYGSTTISYCITSIVGLPLIREEIDLVAGPLVRDIDGRCIGGVISFTAGELAISGGDETNCSQSGGYATIAVEITDPCGNLLALCRFPGLTGTPFTCGTPPEFCCFWTITESVFACTGDGGEAHIVYECTLTPGCSCIPTASITIDGTEYTLTAPSTSINHTVSPCFPGVTDVEVILSIIYPPVPTCEYDCTSNNVTATSHIFL